MNAMTSRLRLFVVERALRGPGMSSPADRQKAFDNADVDGRARALVDTIARNAWKVTDSQVAGALSAGLSEDAVFELAVCAALGQATRQRGVAIAALDEIFGRPAAGGGV